MTYSKATVRTHCSGANIGPGFDNAAVAFENLVLLADAELRTKPGLEIQFTGRYKFYTDERSRPRKVYHTMAAEFADKIKEGLTVYFRNDIKDGGLGTSGANCVAMVEFLNHFFGLGLTQKQKAEYAAIGEPGHSDNVSATAMGGVVFTREYRENPPFEFEPHKVPKNIVPGLLIPRDIVKDGGTQAARGLDFRVIGADAVTRDGLYRDLVTGFDNDDFEEVRGAIEVYSFWPQSVTNIRNQHGIYKVDILRLLTKLRSEVRTEAIFTPSGAGPVMLVLGKDPDATKKTLEVMAKEYRDQGHEVDALVTSFNDSHSRIVG